jgi:hypothetical protein
MPAKKQLHEFFDVYNPEHLKAYLILQDTGMWPRGFIPADVEVETNWQFYLMAKFTDAWMTCAKNERWPTEIQMGMLEDKSSD